MEESLPRASVVKLAKAALPPKTRLSPGLADLLHDTADHLIRSLASRAAAAAESEAKGEEGKRGKPGGKKRAGGTRKPAAVDPTEYTSATTPRRATRRRQQSTRQMLTLLRTGGEARPRPFDASRRRAARQMRGGRAARSSKRRGA